ncbi:guanine deaminase [Patescibacteria group bacterium]|nr:guanine deaminase [Patescibacteria group bacterium]
MPIFRGPILNPQSENQCNFYKDGGVLVGDDGKIEAVGDFDSIEETRGEVTEITDGVIVPAFVDVHVHMPQNHVRGQFAGQLLPWLQNCIWPEEAGFRDPRVADEKAKKFYQDLAGQGTLLSLVYATIHEHALHSTFAHKIGDTIAGNVLMDENSPDYLSQSTEEAIAITERCAREYGEHFAVTPRFAPTCTMELMMAVGEIARQYRTWIQSHLSENLDEVKWVSELFPDCDSYTDVYQKAGLLSPRTIMAHCIHLSDEELDILKETGTKIAHCPTSNIALGSGRMPVEKIRKWGIPFALGSDVGAGPSLSLLHVMQKYMEQHVEANVEATPQDALYRATLAGAELLDRGDKMGNLDIGKEANLVIVKTDEQPKDAEGAIRDIVSGSMEELEGKVEKVYFQGKEVV